MEKEGKPFLILLIAVLLVGILSLFAWEDLSDGKFKSFDMLGDIRPGGPDVPQAGNGSVYIDPDLQALNDNDEVPDNDDNYNDKPVLNVDDVDTLSIQEQVAKSFNQDFTIHRNKEKENPEIGLNEAEPEIKEVYAETIDPIAETKRPNQYVVDRNPVPGSFLVDYSYDQSGMERLKRILNQSSDRLVRIAFLGDSYIEGDIFTEGVRSQLQEIYGGEGVGYVPLYSEIPGFRKSVIQNCSGWESVDFRSKKGRNNVMIQGFSSIAEEGASTTYNASTKTPHSGQWSKSRLLFKTPSGGGFSVKVGTGADKVWQPFRFAASDSVRLLEFDEPITRLSVANVTPGVNFMGAYLDGEKGVAVDNMSIRGYAGIRHDEISKVMTDQTRGEIDYDIIVLEFGINALSSQQTNYAPYGKKMTEVVQHLKKLYPNALFIVMGIGDRGEKRGGEVHSMATIPAMLSTQRRIAQETGAMFWDTRAAMGGEDAVVEWSRNKDINKDYIHLSFMGGKRLASLFVNSIEEAVK